MTPPQPPEPGRAPRARRPVRPAQPRSDRPESAPSRVTRSREPGLALGLRRASSISRWLIAGLAFVILVASGYAWALYKNFTAGVPHGAPVPVHTGAKDVDGTDQDILMIGNDSRVGATRAELRALHTGHNRQTVNTDTMMVLHIPADGSAPSVISFPRDSWVTIPGYGKGKLNSAFSDAYNAAREHGKGERQSESDGIMLTLRTLSNLTGLHIDHYIEVNLFGFYRISEAIGGVQVCLLHPENASVDPDSGINLPAGVSTIEGAQALAFVRQRHGLPNGDLDRIKRQQYFLAAAFKKIESAGTLLNPFKLHRLLDAVSSSLLTDPSLNLLSLARSVETLATGSISFQTLPNDGPQVIYPDGVETAIVRVDYAAIPSFIRSVIGKHQNLDSIKAATPRHVTLDVLNGANVYRLATRNATALKRAGFKIDVIDSTLAPVTATTVEYPPGRAAAAKAVLAEVKGARVVETSSVSRVTLQLGTDGKQVTGLKPWRTKRHAHDRSAAAKAAKKSHLADGLGCIN